MTTPLAVTPTAPIPTPVDTPRVAQDPLRTRPVERSEPAQAGRLISPGAAVLRLLRNSAERFRQLVETHTDIAAAEQVTGFRGSSGTRATHSGVDVYA